MDIETNQRELMSIDFLDPQKGFERKSNYVMLKKLYSD